MCIVAKVFTASELKALTKKSSAHFKSSVYNS